MAAVASLAAGCGTVTSVRGWDGGLVAAGTSGDDAVVRYWAPRPGWTLTVDRATVDGPTVTLWLTAAGEADGPLDRTPIEATWRMPAAASIDCVQAHIRLPRGARTYKPAAVGCGPIAP